MASGRSHDRLTSLLAFPFGLLWWPFFGLSGTILASSCFLFGGLWLSPDLDTISRSTRRWGPLSLLWWPYRRLLSHRSMFSHTPLLGMGLRLVYLGGAILMLSAVLAPLGGPTPGQLAAASRQEWQSHRSLLLLALVSLEASSWLHLLQDGDPVPRLPRLVRWSLGRYRLRRPRARVRPRRRRR
jgi:uncharacterized metal-binding protein